MIALMRVSMQQFETAAQAAIDSIPDEFLSFLENTVFVIEESSPDDLMGLYEGATALAGLGMPERITLYKRSHERAASSRIGAGRPIRPRVAAVGDTAGNTAGDVMGRECRARCPTRQPSALPRRGARAPVASMAHLPRGGAGGRPVVTVS